MNSSQKKSITILVAEDDDADFKLAMRAFTKLQLVNEVTRVKDGQDLVDYLRGAGIYANQELKKPCLILLDLNMPRKDGREALKEIKSDPTLKHIPIIVMTTSQAEEDVVRSYQLGTNAYVRKPVKQEDFMQVLTELKRFWLDIVELPFI